MFRKRNRSGTILQSGRKVGLSTEASGNPKRPKDLRSTLTQTRTGQGRVRALKTKSSASRSLVDARHKISTKSSRSKPPVRSISLFEARRKEQRSNLQQQNRSLTLSDGGYIQVTTRQEIPPDRCATMMGDSIRVTAKVERSIADMERKADLVAGFLTITAKNEEARKKEKEHEARMKREKEMEARKRERESEARKRERENGAKRREKDAKRRERDSGGLFSRMTREDELGSLNMPELYSDLSSRDSVFEGRLDQNNVQPERVSLPDKRGTPTSAGTRITVSNLHPLVSQQDVEELFGVVGQLRSCKMLSRGSAEVVYDKKGDAVFALTRYHNRKLDGQPMQCRLNTSPSAALYSPPSTRLAPLPPLHPREAPLQKPLQRAGAPKRETRTLTQPSRPVVFKVRI